MTTCADAARLLELDDHFGGLLLHAAVPPRRSTRRRARAPRAAAWGSVLSDLMRIGAPRSLRQIRRGDGSGARDSCSSRAPCARPSRPASPARTCASRRPDRRRDRHDHPIGPRAARTGRILGSPSSSSIAHRVVVRGDVSAEAVVERHRIEHLLVERLRIGVVVDRQVEPRGDARRRGPQRPARQERGTRAAIRRAAARRPRARPRPARAPCQPVHGQRGHHAETHQRHHPEPRRHAEAVEARQPHQPAVRRLVQRALIHDASDPARARTSTSRRRRADRTPARIGGGTPRAPAAAGHQRQRRDERQRQRLVGAGDRHQPDAADGQLPGAVGRSGWRRRRAEGPAAPANTRRTARIRRGSAVRDPERMRVMERERRQQDDRQAREQVRLRALEDAGPIPRRAVRRSRTAARRCRR